MRIRSIVLLVFSLLSLGVFLIVTVGLVNKQSVSEEQVPSFSIDMSGITAFVSGLYQEAAVEIENHRSMSMLHFGDMMLDRNVANAMGEEGISYLLDDFVQAKPDVFEHADIIAANLEGPVVEHRIFTTKEIAFRFAPNLVEQLAAYGFNLFTLANNHTLDMGHAGVDETRAYLDAAGIEYYGHQTQINASSTLYKEIDGIRFAFIGINDTHPNTDIKTTLELINEAEEKADITVINVHWGIEYQPLSSARQRDLSHQFIDAGVDFFIGHHPHVVQEMEIYKNRFIFYSLGNFVFDQYFSVPTQQSLGLHVMFDDTQGVAVTLLPIKGERSKVLYMNDDEAKDVMDAFFERSRLGEYTFSDQYRLYLPYDN